MTTSAQEGATSSIDFALEGRLFPAVAVHGSQALVFGGQAPGRNGELFLDAAILDAGTSQWATIPQAPFEEPLYQPAAVAVDRGFVVVGVRCSEDASEPGSSVALCNPGGYAAARYDLSTSSWERLPDMRPPDPEGGGGALAIGSVAGAPYFIADGVVSHFDADAGWIDVARPSVNLERFCATSAGLLGVTLPDSYDL
ncbi:MAG TPA: hypothetical protein VFK43_08310, partial [Acidimicrobiales bacterium]|nr:hypothetical protein [Acidimicrobiales bacterium]